MLVEGPGKVAVQELVVEDGLGNDVADELEVAQMVRVAVGRRIRHVGDPIARVDHEQGIARVEDLLGNDHVPVDIY